jgi:hypothetical protein
VSQSSAFRDLTIFHQNERPSSGAVCGERKRLAFRRRSPAFANFVPGFRRGRRKQHARAPIRAQGKQCAPRKIMSEDLFELFRKTRSARRSFCFAIGAAQPSILSMWASRDRGECLWAISRKAAAIPVRRRYFSCAPGNYCRPGDCTRAWETSHFRRKRSRRFGSAPWF